MTIPIEVIAYFDRKILGYDFRKESQMNTDEQISQEEANAFHFHCKSALEIYNKSSQNGSDRKIIIGGDSEGNGLIFIQANKQELNKIYEYLKKLK